MQRKIAFARVELNSLHNNLLLTCGLCTLFIASSLSSLSYLWQQWDWQLSLMVKTIKQVVPSISLIQRHEKIRYFTDYLLQGVSVETAKR